MINSSVISDKNAVISDNMVDKLLKKHAKNFVSKEPERKALEGIHYSKNGFIYVTNSHTLLSIENGHTEQKTVHYKTGKEMDMNYPKVGRLLDVNYDETLTLKLPKAYIPLIKVASNIDQVGMLSGENGDLLFRVVSPLGDSFEVILGQTDTNLIVDLNVLYFHNALNFFKDAGVDEVTILFNGSLRPVSFRADQYEILILPVRRD